jgi:hypothetical protein
MTSTLVPSTMLFLRYDWSQLVRFTNRQTSSRCKVLQHSIWSLLPLKHVCFLMLWGRKTDQIPVQLPAYMYLFRGYLQKLLYRVYLKGVAKVWGWILHTTNMKKSSYHHGPEKSSFPSSDTLFLSDMLIVIAPNFVCEFVVSRLKGWGERGSKVIQHRYLVIHISISSTYRRDQSLLNLWLRLQRKNFSAGVE